MKKILVSIDGSDNSKRALLQAKKVARCVGANIDIITIVEYLVISPYMSVKYKAMPLNDNGKEDGEKILKEALTLFEDFEGEVNASLESGDPANVIIEKAEDEGYDLVVMGSRGLGTFSKTILGSVSNKVLNHSDTNVLIVK